MTTSTKYYLTAILCIALGTISVALKVYSAGVFLSLAAIFDFLIAEQELKEEKRLESILRAANLIAQNTKS